MSKANARSKTKAIQERYDRLILKHDEAYAQIVQLYQDMIVEHVADDTKFEKELTDYIFKKCNVKWIEYCRKNSEVKPRPDSFYFFNQIKSIK